MTVAIAVKVFDGLVFATDSASTLTLQGGAHQVWNNANKIFNLHRELPIAAMTWGLGNIGSASIATLAKDLRRRFMGLDPDFADWELDSKSYDVKNVAEKFNDFFFDEMYEPTFRGLTVPPAEMPAVGFLIGGISAAAKQSEVWGLLIDDPAAKPTITDEAGVGAMGWICRAQPEAVNRLFNGFDPALPGKLQSLLPDAEYKKVEQLFDMGGQLARQPVAGPMPFADAIGLARYLVDVTCGYSRYLLGPDTVGGPVEVAAISRHEGFKWISRKHYYQRELNPKDHGHDLH